MCLPLAALPIFLGVTGAGLQLAGQMQSRGARAAMLKHDIEKQRRYEQEALRHFEASKAQSMPEAVQRSLSSSQQGAYDAARQALAVPLLPSSPQLADRQVDTARTRTAIEAETQRAAPLFALSDWDQQRALKNLEANDMLRVVSGFSRDLQSTLATRLAAAGQSGQLLGGLGGLLSLAGLATGIAGLPKGVVVPEPAIYGEIQPGITLRNPML